MNNKIVLCLDSQACCSPELVGLMGENFEAQNWLTVFCNGTQTRMAVKDDKSIKEVWVVSCDDIEPINLAAALKKDRPDLSVGLVVSEGCGSLYSRAHTALIDEVYEISAFVRRYGEAKQRALNCKTLSPVISPTPAVDCYSDNEILQSKTGRTPTHMRPTKPVSLTPPSTTRKGFLLSIVSGSGGAGKSAFSVLAGKIAAQRGMRTLLLDYDLQFGNMAVLAQEENTLAIDIALKQPEKMKTFLEKQSALSVLSAPAHLETAEGIIDELPSFIDGLSGYYDVIVANTGAAWAEHHAALLERSSIALFLIDQHSSSIRGCRHALELCARCGIASGPFRYALNRCSKNAPFNSMDVSNMLQGASVYELKEGGTDVEDCLSSGAIEELLTLNNEFVKSVEYVLNQFLPIEEGSHSSREEVREARHGGHRRNRRMVRRREKALL